MNKFWLPIIALLILFPLGHLVRWEITSTVALYPQDIIVGFLSFIVLSRLLRHKIIRAWLNTGPLAQMNARQNELRQAKPEDTTGVSPWLFIFPQPLALGLGAFALAVALSLLTNLKSVTASQFLVGSLYALRWVSYAGVFFYVREFLGHNPFKLNGGKYPLLNLLAMSGVALAFLGLAQYAFYPDTRAILLLGWDEHFYRLIGPILDPDFMGILLILAWFLLLGLPLSKKTKTVTSLIVLAALFLTYSRGSYLAWGGGSLVFLWLKKKLQYALIGLAVFALILLILPKPGGSGVDLTRTFSIHQRLVSWQEGVVLFTGKPLLGHGFNLLRYQKEVIGLLPKEYETNHGATGIQNSYLFILATTGIIGLAAFGYFLSVLFKAKTTTAQFFVTKQSSLTALSLHALFTTTWIYPWVLLWLWLFLAGSIRPSSWGLKAKHGGLQDRENRILDKPE
ncbi:MAG: O-antigen ligase family protein [Candidatus Chisholmbacteria bacterium]|nr:O-antigen ligase family protein [Candidatus Chisholmbacteria bacterium]